MLNDTSVSTLLLKWQDGKDQGHAVAAADQSRQYPEPAPTLQRRLEDVRPAEQLAPTVSVGIPAGAAFLPSTWSLVFPGAGGSASSATPLRPGGCCTPADGVSPAVDSLPPPAPPRAAVVCVPGYDILGLLGRGGMGVVYKARQASLSRLVAIKMILHGDLANDGDRERFRREAEAVAHLQHPHIVQIYEVGEYNDRPYFSLEFCPGGTLEKKLKGTPLPAREAAALVEKLARAMHAAHLKGIVHRDLKPANVLLLEDGTPKITDFGMVKRLDESHGPTQTGAVMGTPSYMAPEQAAGKAPLIGPISDVYALGAILYEILTGRPPFRAATTMETLALVMTQEAAPPQRLQPSVPRDLDTICLKCLQKEPARRYASAQALADDLGRFLAHEPIQARPIGTGERALKWARRKPAVAALVAVALLAPVVLSVLYAVYASERASQHAELYKQELKRINEQQAARERSSKTLLSAQKFEAAGQWHEANIELARAWTALEGHPELRADDLRAELRRRLDRVQEQLHKQEQRQQTQQRLNDFHRPHDDALFYYTLFTGLNAADSRIKARTAARVALDLYGLAAKPGPEETVPTLLQRDRSHLTEGEYTRLVEACYELLLIWADTEAGVPGPGQADAAAPQRAATALALLTRAERLGKSHGLQTRTHHLRQARYTAQRQGKAFDAAALDRTVPARPTSALDWFLEGLERYRAGEFVQATQACGEVLRHQESHFWARYVHALCDLRLGRWVDAKAELTFCITRRQDFVWPRLLRGFAASELGFSYTGERLAADEFELAEEDFDQALKQDRDPAVQYVGLTNRGVLHIRQKHWPAAIVDLQAALKVNPAGVQAYLDLALAYQGQGNLDGAVAMLDEASKRAPELAMVYENRARLHLRRSQWAAAQADLEKAIAYEPQDSKAKGLIDNLVELGRLLHREGMHGEALARFDRVLEIQPSFVLVQRFRAETLLALERPEDAGKALDHYLAQTRMPAPEVYQARGLIHAALRQLPAAIQMYSLALGKRPADKVTLGYRGWTYLLTNAAELALKDFEECLAVDGANPDALVGRATARLQLRQLEGALEDAEAAERRGPLNDRQLYNLARFYSLVVVQLEAEARTVRARPAQALALRAASYTHKAVDFLGQAVAKLPLERRAAFWRSQVQTDPAFAPLRRGSRYVELAARHAG